MDFKLLGGRIGTVFIRPQKQPIYYKARRSKTSPNIMDAEELKLTLDAMEEQPAQRKVREKKKKNGPQTFFWPFFFKKKFVHFFFGKSLWRGKK